MTTAKEKADILYYWYSNLLEPYVKNSSSLKSLAKKSALICVDEIQKTLSENVFTEIEFWQDVKTELEKL